MDNKDFEIEVQDSQNDNCSNVQLPLNFLTFGEIESDDVKVYIKQDVYKALEKLASLRQNPRSYSAWQQVGGYTATAAFFTLFFGGGVREFLCAALCGFVVGVCLMFGQRLTGTNMFFRTVVCSALLACLAWGLGAGLGANTDQIAIGTLMVLVPGMALTNAMREIMAGDVFSGLHRTAEVILVATAIALGTALPVVLERLL